MSNIIFKKYQKIWKIWKIENFSADFVDSEPNNRLEDNQFFLWPHSSNFINFRLLTILEKHLRRVRSSRWGLCDRGTSSCDSFRSLCNIGTARGTLIFLSREPFEKFNSSALFCPLLFGTNSESILAEVLSGISSRRFVIRIPFNETNSLLFYRFRASCCLCLKGTRINIDSWKVLDGRREELRGSEKEKKVEEPKTSSFGVAWTCTETPL